MPLFRVCDPDRRVTKLVSATTLCDLIEKSRKKLNVDTPGTAKIVLECDGAEVDDEEIFQELAISGNTLNTLLMLIVTDPPEAELDHHQHHHLLDQELLMGGVVEDFALESAYSFASGSSSGGSGMSGGGDFNTFEIPWSHFPKNFMLACHRQQMPDVSDRRKMIRVLADAMMQINPRPPRHCIRQIAEEVVRIYPHSLADRCGTGGRKSDSMFFYLENRIANCNRGKCTLAMFQQQHQQSSSPSLQSNADHHSAFEVPEECGASTPPAVSVVVANSSPAVVQVDSGGQGGATSGGGDFSQFTIPWNRFPPGFMDSCQRKEVPDVTDRRKMIRVLADAMMQINRRPARQVIRSVAENVVGCFPISLADRSGVGNLYDSIFFCLDNRIAHCNRGKYAPGALNPPGELLDQPISGRQTTGTTTGSSTAAAPPQSSDDLANFEIPWHNFPLRFVEACQEEAIPEPSDRREMIRVLADEVMRVQLRPPRQTLRRIAERLVATYPKSLEDVCGRGSRYESIFVCLDNRIAHCCRSRLAQAAATTNNSATNSSYLDPTVTVKLENKVEGAQNGLAEHHRVGSNGSAMAVVKVEAPRSSRTSSEEFAHFVLPWDKFPASFVAACERGEHPALGDRQEAVRVLAAEMMRLNRRPPLSSIRLVARALVGAYPRSLADVDGEGHDGLRSCLENRIAHCNRKKGAGPLPDLQRHLERLQPVMSLPVLDTESSLENGGGGCVGGTSSSGTTTDEDTNSSAGGGGAGGFRRRRPTDDCSLDANSNEPEAGEEEEKRAWLAEHFRLDSESRDYERVATYMEASFAYQRSHVNGGSESAVHVAELRDAWPFLFEESLLLRHAERLLNVEEGLRERWSRALSERARTVVELCVAQQGGEEAAKLRTCDGSQLDGQEVNVVAVAMVEALTDHFGDEASSLFQWFDDDTSISDVEDAVKIQTPILAIAGVSKVDTNSRFYVLIEGKVYLRVTDFVSGFLAMLAAYLCFHLHYPQSCSATLQFIQVELLKIVAPKEKSDEEERSFKRLKTELDSRVVRLSNLVNGLPTD